MALEGRRSAVWQQRAGDHHGDMAAMLGSCVMRECAKFCSPFSLVPLNLCQHRNPMGTISVHKVGSEVQICHVCHI